MGNWNETQEKKKETKEKDKARKDKLAVFFLIWHKYLLPYWY